MAPIDTDYSWFLILVFGSKTKPERQIHDTERQLVPCPPERIGCYQMVKPEDWGEEQIRRVSIVPPAPVSQPIARLSLKRIPGEAYSYIQDLSYISSDGEGDE